MSDNAVPRRVRSIAIALAVVWAANIIALGPELVRVLQASTGRPASPALMNVLMRVVLPFWGGFYSLVPALSLLSLVALLAYLPLVKWLQGRWSFAEGLLPAAVLALLCGLGGWLVFGQLADFAAAFLAVLLGTGLLENALISSVARLTRSRRVGIDS